MLPRLLMELRLSGDVGARAGNHVWRERTRGTREPNIEFVLLRVASSQGHTAEYIRILIGERALSGWM